MRGGDQEDIIIIQLTTRDRSLWASCKGSGGSDRPSFCWSSGASITAGERSSKTGPSQRQLVVIAMALQKAILGPQGRSTQHSRRVACET